MLQPMPSAPHRSSSPIVPAYLGLWEAKEVFVPDAAGHLRVDTTRADPELSSFNLLPYGQRIEFTDGYDAKSNASFLVMYLLPPFAPSALQYPCLQYHYTEQNGVPHVSQDSVRHEYDLSIKKGEAQEYEPVGATANEITYFVQAGHEWDCEFYVTKDRQRMWTYISLTKFNPASPHGYDLIRGFQLFHRLAEYKRHNTK